MVKVPKYNFNINPNYFSQIFDIFLCYIVGISKVTPLNKFNICRICLSSTKLKKATIWYLHIKINIYSPVGTYCNVWSYSRNTKINDMSDQECVINKYKDNSFI